MSEAQYEVVIHRAAETELASLTGALGDDMHKLLKQLAFVEEPHSQPYVKDLSEWDQLFRVKVRKGRAICMLEKPTIVVLAVGKRDTIYDKLEIAAQRRESYA
jgi:mRNA-degrading endonuclease RelE of RelBE toxin-antitoxin system